MNQRHIIFKVIILFSLLKGNVAAHDFWLEAHPFYTQTDKAVDLSVHVGNEFAGDSLPNIYNWYTDFSLYKAGSKTKIEGDLGRDPAGYFVPRRNGTYLIGYQSIQHYVEIDSVIFNKYLLDEGLDHAIDYRKKNNLQQQQGKENYIRHVKVLVQAGDDFAVDYSNVNIGYDLEIIPLGNPYQKKLNDHLSVQVLFYNKPEPDILLIAYSKQNTSQLQRVRTGRNGIATIDLNQSGPWLLKAVKIIKLEKEKADWKSHWASITFEIRGY